MMLDIVEKFRDAFERFADEDGSFNSELSEGGGLGRSTDVDWDKVRKLVKLLESFIFFLCMCRVHCMLPLIYICMK